MSGRISPAGAAPLANFEMRKSKSCSLEEYDRGRAEARLEVREHRLFAAETFFLALAGVGVELLVALVVPELGRGLEQLFCGS